MKFYEWFNNNFEIFGNYYEARMKRRVLSCFRLNFFLSFIFVLYVHAVFSVFHVVNCLKIEKQENISKNQINRVELELSLNYTNNDYEYFKKSDVDNIAFVSNLNSDANKNITHLSSLASSNATLYNTTADDKVDADINALDNKLENLSKMIENLENIKSTSKEDLKLNKTTISNANSIQVVKASVIISANMSKNSTNSSITAEQSTQQSSTTSIVKENSKLLSDEVRKALSALTQKSFTTTTITNSTVDKTPNDSKNDKEPKIGILQNDYKDQQYHSILMQSLAIFQEIEMNSDEREKRSYYQIYLIVSFFIYLYLFLTWRLSQKNRKFPANIINDYFVSNLLLLFTIYISHKTSKNLLFQKIGMTVIILLCYNNIFLNILYFSSVLYLTKCVSNSEIRKIIKIVEKIKIYNWLAILFAFVRILYYSNIQIKNCFIGFCIVDRTQRYYLQIMPKKIEIFVIIFLFGYYLIFNAIKKFKFSTNFKEKNPSIEIYRKECGSQKGNNEINTTNHDFRFLSFLSSLIIKNNSINKIFLLEIFYLAYTSFDFLTEYYKFFYFNNFRYEDYSSLHDYYPIVISFLFLFFMGLNRSDFSEWQKAFEDDGLEKENKEADDLIERIYKLKLQVFRYNSI